jgi:hypothetical protein
MFQLPSVKQLILKQKVFGLWFVFTAGTCDYPNSHWVAYQVAMDDNMLL